MFHDLKNFKQIFELNTKTKRFNFVQFLNAKSEMDFVTIQSVVRIKTCTMLYLTTE